MPSILRLALISLSLVLVAACSAPPPKNDAPQDLREFKVVHNIVVAKNAQQGALSRTASAEELETVVKAEIQKRLGRYDGSQWYHLGVSVDGYVLAAPGIPILVAPKSVLILGVTVWDDTAQAKLNAKPHQITVFERAGAGALVGSGYTLSREQQLQELAENAAYEIEKWLAENAEWFEKRAANAPAAPAVSTAPTTGN